MSILLNFTVEEINLISIYGADTIAATITAIDEAMPDILDEDIISIAESASRKLAALSEPEYAALTFTPADDTEAEPDEFTAYAEQDEATRRQGEVTPAYNKPTTEHDAPVS